jgi:hypothetical protein
MKFTNKHNLPVHICAWLAHDEYDYEPDTISMTTLIGPARAWALKRLNADKLTMDYSDLLAVRYGTAIHDSLEKVGVYGEGDFKEKRFYAELMGFRVSGKMDALLGGVIRDNKSTSVWKYVHQEYDEYVKQLSGYRWLLHKNGIEVPAFGFIDFFFTDWKKSDALRGGNYPPIRYQEQRIELWTIEAAEAYIAARLEEFAFALGSLPECTPEELWQMETTWAIFKNGSTATRAYRVAKSLEEAEELAAKIGGSWVKRPGMAKRCGYCTAAPFCDQYKRLKAAGCIDGD